MNFPPDRPLTRDELRAWLDRPPPDDQVPDERPWEEFELERVDLKQRTSHAPVDLAAELQRAWEQHGMPPAPRSCNLHADCNTAPLGADHCHDECCSDCFGN